MSVSKIILDYSGLEGAQKQEKRELLLIKRIVRDYFLFPIADIGESTDHLYAALGPVVISDQEFNNSSLTRHLTISHRMDLNARKILIAEMDTLETSLDSVENVKVILKGNLENFAKIPALALFAHIQGLSVTIEQVASICFLYQAIDQLIVNRQIDPRFFSMNLTPRGWEGKINIPSEGFHPVLTTFTLFQRADILEHFFALSKDQIKLLKSRFDDSVPMSETIFHTIDLPSGKPSDWCPGYQRSIDVNPGEFFVPLPIKKISSKTEVTYVMVVPSFTLLREYYKIKYGHDAVPIMPFLGECSKKTLTTYKIQNKRIFQIGMPEVPTPFTADGLYRGTFGFSLHDLTHVLRDSIIPYPHRKAFCHIVDRILKDAKDEMTKKLNWLFMDGELYRQGELFGSIFPGLQTYWSSDSKKRVLRDMATLADFWMDEFGVGRKDLQPKEQALYDSILPTISEMDRQLAEAHLFAYYKNHPSLEDSSSHCRLGKMYYFGNGPHVSKSKAFKHLSLSQSPEALFFLAHYYYSEDGEEPDAEKAFQYSLQALKGGVIKAYAFVVYCYEHGKGVERNLLEAFDYFKKSTDNLSSEKLFELAIWCDRSEGNRIVKDDALTLKYFNSAAEKGNSAAKCHLAQLFLEEQNIGVDLAKALKYAEDAKQAGHPGAEKLCKQLKSKKKCCFSCC